MTVRIAALVLLVLVSASAQESAPTPASRASEADLERDLERARAKAGVPALAGAVTSGEGLLAIAAVGIRKLGSPERVTIHDRWHLGSCTKSMTATMLARLVARGAITFDTTIGDVFADWDDVRPEWKPVTLAQMLAHRAGMPADLGLLNAQLFERRGTPTEQRRLMAEGVLSGAPATRPGTDFLYANSGFSIAGFMAERKTGKSFEEIMRAEVFEPLSMRDSGFGPPGAPGVVDQPWGHTTAESRPMPPEAPGADNPPAYGPAGTVNATLSDWARYAAAHLRGARGKDGYLSPPLFHLLQTRPKTGTYAFGWVHGERPWANGRVLTHAGSNTMWFSVIWLAPERNVAILAACNAGGPAATAATDAAVGLLLRSVSAALPPVR